MPNLSQILEKKETIKEICKTFGFEEVNIYNDTSSPALTFVVSPIENKTNYQTVLEAYLCKQFDCQITVLDESKIKSLYLEEVKENMALLDNEQTIKELFNQSLSEIEFPEDEKDENYVIDQNKLIDSAKDILSQEKPSFRTDFFKFEDKEHDSTKSFKTSIESDNAPITTKKRKQSVREVAEDSYAQLTEVSTSKKIKLNHLFEDFIKNFVKIAEEHGVTIERGNDYSQPKM